MGTIKKLSIVVAGLATAAYVADKYTRSISTARSTHEQHAATSPQHLSKRDWKRALKETMSALGDKNIPMLAAGVAFFSTLAFFPALAAFISVFSLVADSDQVLAAIKVAEMYLPKEMAGLVNVQLTASTHHQAANVIAAVLATALALWGASGGVQNLINAVNAAYDIKDSRGFVKLKLISLGLVVGGILLGSPLLFLLVVRADWLMAIGTPGWLASSFLVIRWVIITILMVIGLAAFYRYGPDQKKTKWVWVSWGAVAAIIIWLLGTLLFFFYAQNFGSFSENYGVFAGIIVLMTWFNLSAFVVLLGAQVNHRLEAQTVVSTRE
jgi:membrane protein